MADFRQLALEFVLSDDQTKLTSLTQQAASEIQNAPASTNPVARWVEAVQPWMPGSNGDEAMADSDDTPDWTGRSKALEFLSRTLDYLSKDVLKPSQIKLLITFFGAMFDIDHKAGIMPSATALSRIVAMKAFQPASGDDIIQKVCALKDDFPRQIAKTRLAVFELLRSLITNPAVASDLEHKHGASSGFMNDLLQLCRNERDPNCLMVWFDILSYFLREFSPSQEFTEEVYGTFKAYFPITLPRTSQSGITPEELKMQLRKCFTATHNLAPLTFPFLLTKMDQGEGVTVNVKVDVLKTIKACLEEYKNPDQSVSPYTDEIWNSLKYEVRNGEIEDTIWATLEVLKTVATRLQGDTLRDYSLTVTRDCVNDLSNTLYAASAGRLLVSVLSATPTAFVLMVSPAITHIKENLRHPKSPSHSQDLMKLLHVILETRLLLVDVEMTPQEKSDFAAIDQTFRTLYDDVYKKPVEAGMKNDAPQDDLKLATQAVEGAGALVCQRPASTVASPEDADATSSAVLLSGDKCLEISETLFSVIAQSLEGSTQPSSSASDELVNAATKALQRAITAYNPGFSPFLTRALEKIRTSWKDQKSPDISIIRSLGPLIAFVGSSKLPSAPLNGLRNFLLTVRSLQTELNAAIDAKADANVWCALVAGIQAAVRCFSDACTQSTLKFGETKWDNQWVATITRKYSSLERAVQNGEGPEVTSSETSEIHSDFLLISLFVARQLYRRATMAADTQKGLQLSDDFNNNNPSSENQYLHLLSTLAGLVIHEASEEQQISIQAQQSGFNLFQEDLVAVTDTASSGASPEEVASTWDWLAYGRLNVLSFGVLGALRPNAVKQLFDIGVAQEVLHSGVAKSHDYADTTSAAVSRSILIILANKHKLETVQPTMAVLDQQSELLLSQNQQDDASRLDMATSIFAVAAGMLRRYSGKQAQGLLKLLRDSPDSSIGQHLARRLEMVVAPQKILTKENFAIVKPLWMQKAYIELAKPMIPKALGQDAEIQDRVIKTNFSIGVLLLVKHMSFSIYEEDANKILRIAITVAQTIGTGPDVSASLDVIRNILLEAPEKGEQQLASIISICSNTFSRKAHTAPDWLPQGYAPNVGAGTEADAVSGKLALEIMGGLPKMFESRHLLPLAPRVERELTLACGNSVRDLRQSARLARAAWKDIR